MLIRRFAVYVSALCLVSLNAIAESFPTKPIRLIVPFAAGGGNDMLARLISQKAQETWSQPIVIENKPGAGGNIGADHVAKSAPDGYTLLMGTNTLTMTPFIMKAVPFDVQKDLEPVAMLTSTPFMVVVHPGLPVKSIPDLITYAKANPGKLSYATPGVGTPHHLGVELFKAMAGVSMVHVPYRGGLPAVTDLIAGRVDLMWLTINAAIPQVKAGKLRGIAVGEPKRLASLPDIPTIAETVPGYEISAWYAIFARGGTPASVVSTLAAEMQRIFNDSEVLARLAPIGYQPGTSGPGPLAATIARDLRKWENVVRDAGIEPQ